RLASAAAAAKSGQRLRVVATAYCHAGRTASEAPTDSRVAAADPAVLPLGSLIRIDNSPYAGVYTLLGTGAAVKGHTVDIFVPSCRKARQLGRRIVWIRVLRRGPAPS